MAQHDLIWKVLSISIGTFCVLCFAWMLLVPERLKPVRFRARKRWIRKTVLANGWVLEFSVDRCLNAAELNQIQQMEYIGGSLPDGVRMERVNKHPSPELVERVKMLNASGV